MMRPYCVDANNLTQQVSGLMTTHSTMPVLICFMKTFSFALEFNV